MSTAVVSTSAAAGRLFVFDAEGDPHVGTVALGCPVEQSSTPTYAASPLPGIARHDSQGRLPPHAQLAQSTIQNPKFPSSSITPASRLAIRPAPEMASTGIPALDSLTGGLPRGCLTEICGPASSGRTSVLLAALAAATRRGEFCALIDASDAFDPHSASDAGVDLDRLLWVRCSEISPQKNNSPRRHPSAPLRAGSNTEKTKSNNSTNGCPISAAPFAAEVGIFVQSTFNFDRANARLSEHRLEQLLRATDLLLESGGFGLIVLDVADLPPQAARRIPLTTWFRFRRAVEHKPTILLAIEQQPIAGSCSSMLLQLGVPSTQYPVLSSPSHAQLLTELQIRAELVRSRHDRKPARSIAFATKTAWAG